MQQLNEAYAVLSDATQREKYDRQRSDNTNDEFDFSDDTMRSAFREAETEQELGWLFALEYYPDLTALYNRLSKISEKLAFEFRSVILTSKDFSKRHEIADVLENKFLQRYFGTNQTVVTFARELIKSGNKKAAKELNRAVTVLGSNGDPELIIGRIRGKFMLFEKTAFGKTAEGELCTEASLKILREAQARGYTVGLEPNKSFSLTKNGAKTFLYSNADIEHLGQVWARSPDQGS